MKHLSLSFLGPFEVRLGDHPITTFESDKVRALLAYLAVEVDQPHRRSALAGLLWPEFSERAARASLRNALANLRQAIQDQRASPPYLLIDRETIQFDSSSDHWLDLRAFEAHLSPAKQPFTDGFPPSNIENIKSALALFRGEFLHGFSLPDSPAFDEWVLLERENLNRRAVRACETLAQAFELREDFDQACVYAYRLIELEPWHEETHRQLMRLLVLNGDRSAALAQYETCRRILEEELDVEPDSKTIRLYEQIRDGKIRGPARAKPVLHNLPAMLSRFVGREKELQELKNRLEDPDCRLLTLVGPGGCGKTRLAIEAAHQQICYFKHGVYLIPLAGIQTPQAMPQALGQGLSFSFRAERDPWQQILDYLRAKQVLLVIDNFEHLLAGAEMMVELLHTASGVKILATSRTRLNILEENLFPLGGMAFPEQSITENQITDLATYPSVRLFLDGAGRVKADFKAGAQDLEHIGAICRFVEGMPLAVLLAASWSGLLNPSEIAAQIHQDSLDFLETEWGDVPERHRSLRQVFDYSWNLLDTEIQVILAGLSVFPGSFTFQAAQTVTGLKLKTLRDLVDRSMVEISSKERYELHPMMRKFAWEQLDGLPGQKEIIQERHCTFFAEMLAGWAHEMQGPEQLNAQREIGREIENIWQAWDWAIKKAKFDCMVRAIDGLGWLYERLCLYREGEYIFEESVERIQNEFDQRSDKSFALLLARMCGWQSLFNRLLGNNETAQKAIKAGFEQLESGSYHQSKPSVEKAFLLQQKGLLNYYSDRDQAKQDIEDSLELYRQVGDRWHEAIVLIQLSEIISGQGEYQTALALQEKGLAIYRDLSDTIGIAHALINIKNLSSSFGDFERLDQPLHEHAIMLRDLGSPALLADYLVIDGAKLCYLGRFEEADKQMEDSFGIYEDLGDQLSCIIIEHLLGWLNVSRGYYDQAWERYQASMVLAQQVGNIKGIAWGYWGLGEVLLAREANEQARLNLEESVSYFRQVPQQDELGITLTYLANAEYQLGLIQEANTHFFEALKIAHQTGSWQTCLFVVGRAALFNALQGDIEKGIELYALATRYPYVGNSVFWEDTVGRYIKERVAELPKEVIAAAQERGLKRDLHEAVKELLEEYSLSL